MPQLETEPLSPARLREAQATGKTVRDCYTDTKTGRDGVRGLFFRPSRSGKDRSWGVEYRLRGKYAIGLCIKPRLGNVRLDELTVEQVRAVFVEASVNRAQHNAGKRAAPPRLPPR